MGAWIEIRLANPVKELSPSHPTMGAWIEITILVILRVKNMSHPTMGAWIEIVGIRNIGYLAKCRTPRWVRGLKSGSFQHSKRAA